LKLSYSGKTLGGTALVSTAEAGKPYWGDKPEPFEYVVGSTHVTPGFDASVAQMKKGEKRLLIVPRTRVMAARASTPKKSKAKKDSTSPRTRSWFTKSNLSRCEESEK